MSDHLIVILGAAVSPDGRASPALLRRIDGGYRLAVRHPDSRLFCSGGVGRYGPSEASIMAERLVDLGVKRDRLVLDDQSRDTLQTGLAAARYIREESLAGAIVCTDSYHVPRSRLILAALGVPTIDGGVAAGVRHMGAAAWVRMRLRELPAIPYDCVLALLKRRGLSRSSDSRRRLQS